MSDTDAVEIENSPRVDEESKEKGSSPGRKRQPPYAVVLLNDDDHSFQFVIETLHRVFGYPLEKCFTLTEQIHREGRGVVWSGTRELAELKRDQLRSAGPEFCAAKKIEFPLAAIIEPLPG